MPSLSRHPDQSNNKMIPNLEKSNQILGVQLVPQLTESWSVVLWITNQKKKFSFNRDEQKKNTMEQRQIIERKLVQCLKFPKKIQNQGTIRLMEEFAKEHGFSFEESIKYQQYDILQKPIIFQPPIFVKKDIDWYDIFEKIKSQNLKIVPIRIYQNLKKLYKINNYGKSQLKYQNKIHDEKEFPVTNPILGNEEEDGNLQFLIDENQIPHRIIFKNKEEYDQMDWYVHKKNKSSLNVISVNWQQCINNVQKLRENQIQQPERKIIQVQNRMQIELESDSQQQQKQIQKQQKQVQQINSQQNSVKNSNNQSEISQQQSNKSKLVIGQKKKTQSQPQQIDSQIQEELLQQQIQQNQKDNVSVVGSQLPEIVLRDLEIIQNDQIIDLTQETEERILITCQYPKEVQLQNPVKKLQKNSIKKMN